MVVVQTLQRKLSSVTIACDRNTICCQGLELKVRSQPLPAHRGTSQSFACLQYNEGRRTMSDLTNKLEYSHKQA